MSADDSVDVTELKKKVSQAMKVQILSFVSQSLGGCQMCSLCVVEEEEENMK